MISLSEVIASVTNDEDKIPSALCMEHGSCLVYELVLTSEFIRKYGVGSSKLQLTVPHLSIVAYWNYSSGRLEIKIKTNQGKDSTSNPNNATAVNLKMNNGQIHRMSWQEKLYEWHLSFDTTFQNSIRHQKDGFLKITNSTLEIHLFSPKAIQMPFFNATVNRMLNEQSFCDVHFVLPSGENIEAHSQILSIKSPVFRAMLQSDMQEARTKKIKIEDTTTEVLKLFIAFLYTGQLPSTVTIEDCKALLAKGHKYQVEDLQEVAESVLGVNANPGNVIDLLIVADRYSCELLKNRCFQVIKDNAKQLCRTPEWLVFLKTWPDLCNYAVRYIVGATDAKESQQD